MECLRWIEAGSRASVENPRGGSYKQSEQAEAERKTIKFNDMQKSSAVENPLEGLRQKNFLRRSCRSLVKSPHHDRSSQNPRQTRPEIYSRRIDRFSTAADKEKRFNDEMGGFHVPVQPFGVYQALDWLCGASTNEEKMINAARRFRKYIEDDRADDLIRHGVVSRLVECLERVANDNEQVGDGCKSTSLALTFSP